MSEVTWRGMVINGMFCRGGPRLGFWSSLQNTRILGAVGEGPYFILGFMLTHFTVGEYGARFGAMRKKLVSVLEVTG